MILKTFRLCLAYLIVLVLFFSCDPSKKINKSKLDKKMSVEKFTDILDKKVITSDWFSAKAQISYKGPKQSISFSSSIKSEKDVIFWMNGKKFGFEAGRMMVKQDSIFAIDRFNKRFFKNDIGSISSKLDLPAAFLEELNVSNLQNIFIGNSLHQIIPFSTYKNMEDSYLLIGKKEDVHCELYLSKIDFSPQKAIYHQGESIINIKYQDYRPLQDHLFSYKRSIEIKSDEHEMSIDIDYSNVELGSPQEIKFSIPTKYSEMSL